MSKKLITACMALVALAAMALPAVASASPELGETSGGVFSKLATGTKITGTNVGNAEFTNVAGTAVLSTCSKVVVTGELTKNNGTEVEGTVTTVTLSGEGEEVHGMKECTDSIFGNLTPTTNGGGVDGENVENGTPWCLKSGASDTFTVRGNACNKEARKITFILDSTTAGECKYSRAAAISGTFTTDTSDQDAVLSLAPGANTEFTKEAGGVLCASTTALRWSFTLETDSATVTPLYIK